MIWEARLIHSLWAMSFVCSVSLDSRPVILSRNERPGPAAADSPTPNKTSGRSSDPERAGSAGRNRLPGSDGAPKPPKSLTPALPSNPSPLDRPCAVSRLLLPPKSPKPAVLLLLRPELSNPVLPPLPPAPNSPEPAFDAPLEGRWGVNGWGLCSDRSGPPAPSEGTSSDEPPSLLAP